MNTFITFLKFPWQNAEGISSSSKDLFHYTCQHWGKHAQSAFVDVSSRQLQLDFLETPNGIQVFTGVLFQQWGGLEWANQSLVQFFQSKIISNWTSIHLTAYFNLHGVLRQLLFGHGKVYMNAKDNRERTALIWAAHRGHLEVVKELLRVEGVDMNARDSREKTALHYASEGGYLDIEYLLSAQPQLLTTTVNVDLR